MAADTERIEKDERTKVAFSPLVDMDLIFSNIQI
jgi:hypothetical protein